MSVAVAWVAYSVYVVANLYLIVLLVRVGLDWARFFARSWRPSGAALVLANVVYALTDPPLRFLRRFIPPLRLGSGMSVDIGFVVLWVVIIVIQRFAVAFAVVAV
ncbi:YggT family protein [Schaalia georgiae]|uniref:YggT family protein n=1 Tax=Schaalia georgiae TaxID=52768 RepID=UPI0004109D63|nr:YggT family protein [Schaalia georgiae]